MPTPDDPVQVYKELADCYDRRREPPMRDRFLVLAADAALRAGRADEADRFRLRLLKLNPHHMLKPYTSFTQAMQAPDIQTYVRDLRLNYPPEVAVILLNSLRSAADQTLQSSPGPGPSTQAADADATVTLNEPPETFRVFPEQREPDIAETAALPAEFVELARRAAAAGQPQPKTPPPTPCSSAPPKSGPRQQPAPLPPKKKPSASPRPEPLPAVLTAPDQPVEEAEGIAVGGWFAAGLFVIVIVAGVLLGGYILARPFFQ